MKMNSLAVNRMLVIRVYNTAAHYLTSV